MRLMFRNFVVFFWSMLFSPWSPRATAQDSIYTHWPTVQETAFDPAKSDELVALLEELATRPVVAEKRTPPHPALKNVYSLRAARDFTGASREVEVVLKNARATGDQEVQMLALAVIGTLSRDIFFGSSLKAVPYHEEALALAETLKDTAFAIQQSIALADNYLQASKNDLFLDYALKTARLMSYRDYPLHRMSLCDLAGSFFLNRRNAFRAQKMFEMSFSLAEKLGERGFKIFLYHQFLEMYIIVGHADQAQIMLDSIVRMDPTKDAELEEWRYQLEKIKGNREKALTHLEKAYRKLGDVYSTHNADQFAGWETQLKTREKEMELEQEKSRRRVYLTVVFFLALICAGAAYAIVQLRKSRRKLTAQNALIEQQAAGLRRMDEVKNRFFANVSHELRTPLTLMLGPQHAVQQSGELSSRSAAMLQLATANSKKLLGLVNQILDLGKLDSGKLELNETPVAFFPLVRRLAATFGSYAEQKGIRFGCTFNGENEAYLELDVAKLEVILNNLLSNALKFTLAGGRVTVEVNDLASTAQIRVSDTGRGIHPDDLPHVFDRYYQSTLPDLPAEGGTGIGLALSHELALLMHGRLWVESSYGEGSVFTLEIPRKVVSSPAALLPETEDDTPSAAPFVPLPFLQEVLPENAPTVLVVEDNPELRTFLKLILSKKYHVIEAENGEAAFRTMNDELGTMNDELGTMNEEPGVGSGSSSFIVHRSSFPVRSSFPSLIISDLMMPVMDGYQLLEKVKSDDRFRHLPFVMLTARADVQDKLRALRIGVDDYLTKPFDEEELLARVENLLQNSRNRVGLVKAPDIDADSEEALSADDVELAHRPQEDQAWLEQLEITVLERIQDHNFSLEVLSEMMAVGSRQLQRRLKSLTGLTTTQYLQALRFQRARQLLEARQVASVKELTAAVGMRDVKYFSQEFKKRFGKSPSTYLEA